jgi:hypothetical protein
MTCRWCRERFTGRWKTLYRFIHLISDHLGD